MHPASSAAPAGQRDLDDLVADLQHSPLQPLAAHWLDLFRRRQTVPSRSDLDPLQFPHLLKSAWLFSAEETGDFRVRLCGEQFADWYGFNPTGKTFRDICTPAVLPLLQAFARRVIDTPCIILQRVESKMPGWNEPAGFYRIGLPVAGRQADVCHLVGATLFDTRYYNGLGAESSQIRHEACYRLVPARRAADEKPAPMALPLF